MTLQFELNHADPSSLATDCIVLGIFADGTLSNAGDSVDRASAGRLRALIARGDVSGKTGRSLLVHDLPGLAAPRVLTVGLGETAKFGVPQYLRAVAESVRALKSGPSKSALCTLTELDVPGRSKDWRVRQETW